MADAKETFEALCMMHAQTMHPALTQAHVGKAEIGLKRMTSMCVQCWSRSHRRRTLVGLGFFKKEQPPLGLAPFFSIPRHLGLEDVRAVGLQVTNRIGSGDEVHPLAPFNALHPNRPSLKSINLVRLVITSNSLVYQKAKNVKNGPHHFELFSALMSFTFNVLHFVSTLEARCSMSITRWPMSHFFPTLKNTRNEIMGVVL